MITKCDFLVIGSGLAGLTYALKVAEHGQVIILSKTTAPQANTSMAQGGIAAVMSDGDSFEAHIRDTLVAGAGLCQPEVVRAVVESAPDRIQDLIQWGVKFDAEDTKGQRINLTREGGHSHRRILHIQDHTGKDVHAELLKRVQEHPNIQLLENHFAIDLILSREVNPLEVGAPRCLGAYVYDRSSNAVVECYARMTLLATGGAGKTYLYTTNWSGASGDGVAMAYRAGCRVANLEFMQFHPTCLYHPSARNFLISEAVRGEGGELVNSEGRAFAKDYHPQGALAPRDIVARAIDAEMKHSGANCVYIDITAKSEKFLRERFPVIYNKCLEFGMDMAKQPIPVVPAAHYLCGGILTDLRGRTDVAGLLAAGETTCTGLHGANRLASNSLLECLVFAHNAARFSLDNLADFPTPNVQEKNWHPETEQTEDERIVITHTWDEIRRLMWNYVGIVRSNRRLKRAQARLANILQEIGADHRTVVLNPEIIELRNIALVAELTVRCALKRQESRGIHYNIDYPFATDAPGAIADSILN